MPIELVAQPRPRLTDSTPFGMRTGRFIGDSVLFATPERIAEIVTVTADARYKPPNGENGHHGYRSTDHHRGSSTYDCREDPYFYLAQVIGSHRSE